MSPDSSWRPARSCYTPAIVQENTCAIPARDGNFQAAIGMLHAGSLDRGPGGCADQRYDRRGKCEMLHWGLLI